MQSTIVARLKRQHRFDEWVGRNTLTQSLFVYGYLLYGEILPGWHVTREQELAIPGGQSRIHTVWERIEAKIDSLIKLDIYPCSSRNEAHDFIIRFVGNFQSPLIELRSDLPVGDVAFAVPGEAALVFARANVVLFAASVGSVPAPVAEFAGRLDEQLSAEPPRPTTKAQKVETRRLVTPANFKPGARLSLDVELLKPGKQQGYWKFFSRLGEVMLSNGRLIYQASETGVGQVDAYEIPADRDAKPRQMAIRIENSSA